ncbi:hypothetical protein CAAU_0486 [Caloramator australicus RC3]|uniref:Uncharacterized protein n=1 Tax=Caloramator australicus RC3 TaxID=857293 RepID=G0V4U5_9CLOT|nr:hypothetical protein CAAU_0486 [Caloramator australicus RC3]
MLSLLLCICLNDICLIQISLLESTLSLPLSILPHPLLYISFLCSLFHNSHTHNSLHLSIFLLLLLLRMLCNIHFLIHSFHSSLAFLHEHRQALASPFCHSAVQHDLHPLLCIIPLPSFFLLLLSLPLLPLPALLH